MNYLHDWDILLERKGNFESTKTQIRNLVYQVDWLFSNLLKRNVCKLLGKFEFCWFQCGLIDNFYIFYSNSLKWKIDLLSGNWSLKDWNLSGYASFGEVNRKVGSLFARWEDHERAILCVLATFILCFKLIREIDTC